MMQILNSIPMLKVLILKLETLVVLRLLSFWIHHFTFLNQLHTFTISYNTLLVWAILEERL